MLRRTRSIPWLAFSVLAAIAAAADAPADLSGLKENDTVSVREGDAWSPATFSKKEGRRYLVKYDDGTDEWVTADRLKPAGAADKPGPATKPGLKTTAKPGFAVGENLEFKWGGLWRRCKIAEKRGDWTLIEVTGWEGRFEWVEPWRLRKEGSTYDTEYAKPNMNVKRSDPPPRPTPGASPAAKSDTKSDTKSAAKPNTDKQFDAPPTLAVTEAIRTGRDLLPAVSGDAKPVAAAGPKFGATGAPVALPSLGDTFARYRTMQIVGTTAMLPVGNDFGKKGSGLVKVNLAAGATAGITLNPDSIALAISPSGGFVAARSNGGADSRQRRLDVYKIVGRTATHMISFVPGADKADIQDAAWVDDTLVLTSAGEDLTCWDAATATSQWRMSVKPGPITQSADGKVVAVGTSEGITLIDAAAGTVLAVLDGQATPDFSLSPDGKTLVGLDADLFSVWDVATARRLYQIGLPPGLKGKLTAISPEYTLIGPYLFSLTKRAVIWKYEGDGPTVAANGRVFSVFDNDKTKALVGTALPHPAAEKAAKTAPEAVMALAPGLKVSLDLQHDATEDKRQATAKIIESKLAKLNITVAPNQPVKVATRTQPDQTVVRQYRKIGVPNAPIENVTITSKLTTLSVQVGDKVLWSRTMITTNNPGDMVRLAENETVQERANASLHWNDWLNDVSLPSMLAAPVDLTAVPTSRWALGGVKDN